MTRWLEIKAGEGGHKRLHHVCPWWLAGLLDNPLRRLIHPPARILAPWIKPGMRILDAGCGSGFFSVPAAELAGPQGLVLAADIQPRMLEKVDKRAQMAGLRSRIKTHLCGEDDLLVQAETVDFALAFWSAHEAPRPRRFIEQTAAALTPGGLFLLVEPKIETGAGKFSQFEGYARQAGLEPVASPEIRFCRATVFRKRG